MEVSGLSGLASVYSLYNIMPTLDFPVSVKLSSTWRLLFFTAPDVDSSGTVEGRGSLGISQFGLQGRVVICEVLWADIQSLAQGRFSTGR
jgi:hypothetical protein